jgi:hypothetical protein
MTDLESLDVLSYRTGTLVGDCILGNGWGGWRSCDGSRGIERGRVQDQDLENAAALFHASQPESSSSDCRLIGGLFAKKFASAASCSREQAAAVSQLLVVVFSYVCPSSRRMYCLMDEPRLLCGKTGSCEYFGMSDGTPLVYDVCYFAYTSLTVYNE